MQPTRRRSCRADGSNASNEIVGAICDSAVTFPEVAFVYTDAIGTIDLNTLIDPRPAGRCSAAWGINDNHEVVGFGTHNGGHRAYKLTLPDLSACAATTHAMPPFATR